MLKNFKQDIKNIIILLFIVGILSLVLYLIIYQNKGYIKNVKLDLKTYDYNDSDYKYKNESIELDSTITLNDYILDLEFNEENLIAINNCSKENKTVINIYEINLEDKSILNKKTIDNDLLTMYNIGSIPPSREMITYTTSEYSSDNYKNFKNILYNLKDDSYISLPCYFDLISWIPDSSGFYGYKDSKLYLYDISKEKIIKDYKLKNFKDVNKLLFYQDGTKFYTLNSKKNEINIYDLKNNSLNKVTNIKSISNFDIIDDNHLLIKGSNFGKKIYIYIILKKICENFR